MKDGIKALNLAEVPDWRTRPVELVALATAGKNNLVVVEHDGRHIAPYGFEVKEMVDRDLNPRETPETLFDGRYANVEAIEVTRDQLTIQTGVTNSFPYMASAWHYRNNPGQNTIRPLAVQVVIYDAEERKAILVERRPREIVDHPNRLSVLGGALRPGENPRDGACRCLAKWGMNIASEQLTPLALTHEPACRIYCLVYWLELPFGQITEVVHDLIGKRDIWTEDISAGVRDVSEKLLTQLYGIQNWNPLGFLAFACGLFTRYGQGEGKIRSFLDEVYGQCEKWPYRYEFPMQRYLPKSEKQGA